MSGRVEVCIEAVECREGAVAQVALVPMAVPCAGSGLVLHVGLAGPGNQLL